MTVRPRPGVWPTPVPPRKASFMPRPATRRRALAAALACAAMLSACTGNADDGADAAAADRHARRGPVGRSLLCPVGRERRRGGVHRRPAAGAAAREKAFTGSGPRVGQCRGQDAARSHRGREGGRRGVGRGRQGARGLARRRHARPDPRPDDAEEDGRPGARPAHRHDPGGPLPGGRDDPGAPGRRDRPRSTRPPRARPPSATGRAWPRRPTRSSPPSPSRCASPSRSTSKLLAVDPLTEQLRQSAKAQSQALNNQGTFTQTYTPQDVLGGAAPEGRQGRHRLRPPRPPRRDRDAHRAEADSRQGAHPAHRHQADHERGQARPPTRSSRSSSRASGQSRVVAASDQIVAGSGR